MSRLAMLLLILSATPALADWQTAAPAPSVFVTAVPVACSNPDCNCADCQCGPECDCSSAVATVAPATSPPLTIHVWDQKYCPHGDLAEREIIRRLAEEGWKAGKHYRVIRSDDGPCPQFAWHGKPFAPQGFNGWLAWRSELCSAMGVSAPDSRTVPTLRSGAADVSPASAAPAALQGIRLGPGERLVAIDGRPVGQQTATQAAPVRRSIPPARRVWTHYGGGSLADHLRQTHGIDAAGMSHQDQVNAHSHAHEGTWGSVRGGYSSSPAIRQRAYQPVRRVMGAVFGAGLCPNCP